MRIAFACFLTVIIECTFFFLTGSRIKYEGIVVLCANVITNLLLNLFTTITGLYNPVILAILETLAVVSEYLIYRKASMKGNNLFVRTMLANVLSFCLGLIIFR